jgi:hypothetical protein
MAYLTSISFELRDKSHRILQEPSYQTLGMMTLVRCEKDNDRRLVTRCLYIEDTCHCKNYNIEAFQESLSK